jgi:hypothetical protein
MTPDEIRIAQALARCSFAPGTSAKRFVRQMEARAANSPAPPLSDRQRAYLWAVAWSWRRQLPRRLVDLAGEYSGGVGIRGRQVLEERLRAQVATVTQQRARVAPAREEPLVLPTPPDDRQGALFT